MYLNFLFEILLLEMGAIETISHTSLAFAPEIRLSLGAPEHCPTVSQGHVISPALSPNVHTHAQLKRMKIVKLTRSFHHHSLCYLYIFLSDFK